jgi:hypothetical protein
MSPSIDVELPTKGENNETGVWAKLTKCLVKNCPKIFDLNTSKNK